MERQTEIRKLQAAMKTTQDRRMYERYQAVKLVLEGHTRQETAGIIGRSAHTVGKYVAAYEENGMAGLHRKIASGRPPRLTEAQRKELRDIVAYQTPVEVGFPARANWTLALVAELVERKWDISYTQKGIAKILHSLGLSNTRPTYTLEKADPEKQREFQEETFPALKKTPGWKNHPPSV